MLARRYRGMSRASLLLVCLCIDLILKRSKRSLIERHFLCAMTAELIGLLLALGIGFGHGRALDCWIPHKWYDTARDFLNAVLFGHISSSFVSLVADHLGLGQSMSLLLLRLHRGSTLTNFDVLVHPGTQWSRSDRSDAQECKADMTVSVEPHPNGANSTELGELQPRTLCLKKADVPRATRLLPLHDTSLLR